MLNKALKNKNGITLIALIITIIVLLILAGVTIAAITSNESAPNKAVEARQKNEEGAAKDAATLLVAGKIQSYYEEKYVDRTSNAGTILSYLEDELSASKNVITDGYKIVVSGGRITATKTGETAAFVLGTVSSEGVITWIEPVPIISIGAFTPTSPEVGEGKTITLSVAINQDATDSVVWSSADETVATVAPSGQNTATVSGKVGKAGETVKITAKNAENSVSAEVTVTVIPAPVEADLKTSYVGYYAYVDGVYGVIYADLLAQTTRSGQWGNSNGTWSLPTAQDASAYKTYEVRPLNTGEAKFGNRNTGVLTVSSTDEDLANRFYVMEITNRGSPVNWSTACGTKLPANPETPTWVLPSKTEWSIFGSSFGITKSNYSTTYGLSNLYWSSAEYSSSIAWVAYFGIGGMDGNTKTGTGIVRLCTTF